MTQAKRLEYLITVLKKEMPRYERIPLPSAEKDKKHLFRALVNLRPPMAAGAEFLRVQDAYLQEEIRLRGVIDAAQLRPVRQNLCLWKGDITALRADAIVNAANSRLLGCFIPCHGCIDNAIHTYAGVQLRLACDRLMGRQDGEEAVGRAKITPAFNLPSRYILHTVGPVAAGRAGERECDQLASCYRSCLALAAEHGVESLAFCCISTGEFGFPNRRAAQVAVETVEGYFDDTNRKMKVIFNVFGQKDYDIYRRLLGED